MRRSGLPLSGGRSDRFVLGTTRKAGILFSAISTGTRNRSIVGLLPSPSRP